MTNESKNPRVSLAMPVYNGEPYLTEAISSCLAQDYDNFELVITDNASTDGTEAICRAIAASDSRVKYIRNEKNMGAGPNFNLGFKNSSGKYLKWCASDDRVSSNYLSACVAFLENHPDVVLAYGKTISINTSGEEIPLVGRGRKEQQAGDGVARRFKNDLDDRGTNFEIFGVFRRSALELSLLHRPYYGSDITLVNELSLLGRFALVQEATFYNREHPRRSMNIKDKKVLLAWQDSTAGVTREPRRENVERLRHLIEIAFRHRRRAPFWRVLGVIGIWTAGRTRESVAVALRKAASSLSARRKLDEQPR